MTTFSPSHSQVHDVGGIEDPPTGLRAISADSIEDLDWNPCPPTSA